MAHQDDADTKNAIFSRLKPTKYEHLKPLSAYSRLITCEQKQNASLHPSCNPFMNLKIEVVNDSNQKKRKLDPDDRYETPAKKEYSPQAVSPDLGCFMDFPSPPTNQDNESPLASVPAPLNKTQAIESEIKQSQSSEPHWKNHLNATPFDLDVDDILCLNPLGTCAAGAFSDNVQRRTSPNSNTFQNKPALAHNGAQRAELGRGDGQRKEGREEPKPEMHQNLKNVEEDKGYFSMSYLKDHEKRGDSPQLPPVTSSAVCKRGEDEQQQPESAPEPGCHKQAAQPGHDFSFTVLDSGPVVRGPPMKPVDSLFEPLVGDVEELWNIGPPLLESSVCNVSVKLSADSEQNRPVSEEVRGGVTEPVNKCQAAVSGQESTLDTSYETSLPLQVQVKSVVVAVGHHPSSSKPAAPVLPYKGPNSVRSARTERPVIIDSRVNLERDKRTYLQMVNRHLNENQGGNKDVMTELMNLMTHVVDHKHDAKRKQLQHPSDLTRRNYQRRFGNAKPTMSLRQWHTKNSATYKRFAQLPKIFHRTPCP